MPISSTPFEMEYNGKRLAGDCTVIDLPGNTALPYKYPIYRLSFNNHRIKPEIYLFYRTDAAGKPFFWYAHPGKATALLVAMAKELEKGLKNN